MTTFKLIAIDCDGVLLDYSSAYGQAWTRAFGSAPTLVNPNAYWPMERWGVPRLVGSELDRFRTVFDESFWSSIPAVAGAVEACHQLVKAGFVLVCVTALDDHNLEARRKNLLNLGFPLSEVIATPHQAAGKSPKADVLNEIRPLAFVDDYAPYMHGVDASIHKALIVRDPFGGPNTGEALHLVNSTHADLRSFADFWCSLHAAALGPSDRVHAFSEEYPADEDIEWDNIAPVGREFGSPDFDRLMAQDAAKFNDDMQAWIRDSQRCVEVDELQYAMREFRQDINNIESAFKELSQAVSAETAAAVWLNYSKSLCAGWMTGADTVKAAARALYLNCPRSTNEKSSAFAHPESKKT